MNIKELAKRAGVSSATVSRVLNNSGYVKEETRKKVLEAVEEYHYVPSAIARNLSINDNPSIGVIIPDIENEFFLRPSAESVKLRTAITTTSYISERMRPWAKNMSF